MKIKLMSMAELDRIVRNSNADEHLRRRCLTELILRESQYIALSAVTQRGNIHQHYAAPGL